MSGADTRHVQGTDKQLAKAEDFNPLA